MINRFFNKENKKKDLETRLERLTWIYEHITIETRNEMLVAVIIEICQTMPLYERKLIQRIIEKSNNL